MEIKYQLRPCIVSYFKENKKALFHCFDLQNGNAIIEFEDGECTTVAPWDIKFLDNKFKEYYFDKEN